MVYGISTLSEYREDHAQHRVLITICPLFKVNRYLLDNVPLGAKGPPLVGEEVHKKDLARRKLIDINHP
jgi:hypothetical protein